METEKNLQLLCRLNLKDNILLKSKIYYLSIRIFREGQNILHFSHVYVLGEPPYTYFFRVNKRFPTMEHVIAAGLMRSDELKCMEDMDDKSTVSKWWMPLVWATNIVDRAR
jgi:hypothetical protein